MDRVVTNHQSIIDNIDRNLVFRNVLSLYAENGTLKPIYEVELNGESYVLKIARQDIDESKKHFLEEVSALQNVSGIEGVTQLVRIYETFQLEDGVYRAILKEFFSGNPLTRDSKIGASLEAQLRSTVEQLHKKMLVHLDLFPENIVVSPDKTRLKIVDLGKCFLFYRVNKRFQRMMNRDMNNLEILLNMVKEFS